MLARARPGPGPRGARRGRRGGPARGGVPRAAGVRHAPVRVESWVSEMRAATFTMAYEVSTSARGQRRVYLRARPVLTPYVFAEERPRRISPEDAAALEPCSSRGSTGAAGARGARGRPPGHTSRAGALVRRRHLPPRQQREVLRVLPGGADPVPARRAARGRRPLGATWWSRGSTWTTSGRSCSGSSRTTCTRGSPRSAASPRLSAEIRDGDGCWRAPRWCGGLRHGDPAGAPRIDPRSAERAARPRATCAVTRRTCSP